MEVESCDVLLEGACHSKNIEELTDFSKLKSDELSLRRTTWLRVSSIATFDLTKNVFMLQLLHGLYFCVEKLSSFFVHCRIH